MSTMEAVPSRALGVLGGRSGCNITGLYINSRALTAYPSTSFVKLSIKKYVWVGLRNCLRARIWLQDLQFLL